MLGAVAIDELAAKLRASRGVAAKRDIAAVVAQLGLSGELEFAQATIAPRFPTAMAFCCWPSKAS